MSGEQFAVLFLEPAFVEQPSLTRNQVRLLALLRAGACDENAMVIRWPARSWEGIRRTVASVRELGLIDEHGDGWSISDAGRQALARWS